MTNSRFVALAVMVALFLTGAIAGGVAVALLSRDDAVEQARFPRGERPPEGRRGRAPGPRGFAADRFVERLAAELDLTPDQRAEVEAILEEQRLAAEATLRELAPRLRAGVDSAQQQIRRVLDDDQRARFEALVRRDRGLLGRRFPQGVPPAPPP